MHPLATLRVGMIPYLNAWPYRNAFGGAEPRWRIEPPRALGERAAAGQLDAALLASRDALALSDRFRPLGDLGIARHGAVESVLLFSDRPAEHLSGARVALTAESRTSRALVRILLDGFLRVPNVSYVPEGEPAEACLAIGDTALALREAGRFPHVLDLGECWTRATDLPFVYARWVVRRDLATATAHALGAALRASLAAPLEWTGAPLPDGLDARRARAYLARFVYRLGPAERQGLDRFREELERHDLLRHHGHHLAMGSAA